MNNIPNNLNELIEASLEGLLTPEQARQLERLIESNPIARRYYYQYINLSLKLNMLNTEMSPDKVASFNNFPIPALEISSEIGLPITKNLRKTRIFKITAIAAIFLIMIMAGWLIIGQMNIVGSISDEIDAVWSKSNGCYIPGRKLKLSDKSYFLEKGYVELVLDNQTRLVIESPTIFQILSSNKIALQSGRIFAEVPGQASGFTIITPEAEIIDLGTEFGVYASQNSETELYVFKGKTKLVTTNNTSGSELIAGDAVSVSGAELTVTKVGFDNIAFVREIESKRNIVWKGQSHYNLADFVGGGSGFGNGRDSEGYDQINGEHAYENNINRTALNTYRIIDDNPFIDGVFLPNGQTEQVISSNDHIFRNCPITNSMRFNGIFNSYRKINSSAMEQCLIIHSNAGITFDLNEIRKIQPDKKIIRFESQYGIEPNPPRPTASNADFWVLIDGEIVFYRKNVKDKQIRTLSVTIPDNARFLTLVTTDGGDPDQRVVNNQTISAIDSDWCMFANPILVTE